MEDGKTSQNIFAWRVLDNFIDFANTTPPHFLLQAFFMILN